MSVPVCMSVIVCVCVCVCVHMRVLKVPEVLRYRDLAEDEMLKMTYETRPNPLYSGQITVAVVFR